MKKKEEVWHGAASASWARLEVERAGNRRSRGDRLFCSSFEFDSFDHLVLGKGDLDYLQFFHRYKTELIYHHSQRFFVTK